MEVIGHHDSGKHVVLLNDAFYEWLNSQQEAGKMHIIEDKDELKRINATFHDLETDREKATDISAPPKARFFARVPWHRLLPLIMVLVFPFMLYSMHNMTTLGMRLETTKYELSALIEDNKDTTFFAYLSFYTVHNPMDPRADLLKKYQAKK